jgi:transcriptional regulator with XRE-family HTH domain
MNHRVKIVRETVGLSQSEFASRLAMNQTGVSMVESGRREVSPALILKICSVFGVDEHWLRTGEGEPFQQRTREEEIMRFAVRAAKGSDGFRKQLAFMLSQLDEEDWENLEKIYQKQLDRIKNSDRG